MDLVLYIYSAFWLSTN